MEQEIVQGSQEKPASSGARVMKGILVKPEAWNRFKVLARKENLSLGEFFERLIGALP